MLNSAYCSNLSVEQQAYVEYLVGLYGQCADSFFGLMDSFSPDNPIFVATCMHVAHNFLPKGSKIQGKIATYLAACWFHLDAEEMHQVAAVADLVGDEHPWERACVFGGRVEEALNSRELYIYLGWEPSGEERYLSSLEQPEVYELAFA